MLTPDSATGRGRREPSSAQLDRGGIVVGDTVYLTLDVEAILDD